MSNEKTNNSEYKHIQKMESIMVMQENLLKQLEEVLDAFENSQQDYQELLKYYYSNQRFLDLEADENNLIPDEIARGVLSEDGIYNLSLDTQNMAIRMMEVAVKVLKTNIE